VRRRIHAAERLDAPDGHDLRELEASLAHVHGVNRWLGGLRALRRHLRPLLGERSPVWILDVGTGAGAVPAALHRWARRRGADWRFVGLDLHPQMLHLARAGRREGRSVTFVQGDALRLPFRDHAFTAACCTLTLHHFDDEDAVRLLRELARVSRHLVLVNDLERHPLNHLGARLLACTVWRSNPLTRHDGPLSVLRAFRPGELLELGRRAGLRNPRVARHVPYRLVLTGRPGTHPGGTDPAKES